MAPLLLHGYPSLDKVRFAIETYHDYLGGNNRGEITQSTLDWGRYNSGYNSGYRNDDNDFGSTGYSTYSGYNSGQCF